jgi:hypothetical protein
LGDFVSGVSGSSNPRLSFSSPEPLSTWCVKTFPAQSEGQESWPLQGAGTRQSGASALVSELIEARDEKHLLRFQ